MWSKFIENDRFLVDESVTANWPATTNVLVRMQKEQMFTNIRGGSYSPPQYFSGFVVGSGHEFHSLRQCSHWWRHRPKHAWTQGTKIFLTSFLCGKWRNCIYLPCFGSCMWPLWPLVFMAIHHRNKCPWKCSRTCPRTSGQCLCSRGAHCLHLGLCQSCSKPFVQQLFTRLHTHTHTGTVCFVFGTTNSQSCVMPPAALSTTQNNFSLSLPSFLGDLP